MFWHRKSRIVTLDSLDARVTALEARADASDQSRSDGMSHRDSVIPPAPVSQPIESALRKMARSGGFELSPPATPHRENFGRDVT